MILDTYFPAVSEKSQGKKQASIGEPASFLDFFRVVVDDSLFAATSSAERKSWGFSLFEAALPRLTRDELPVVFGVNFMRTWINHLHGGEERVLHKSAMQIVS